MSRGKGADCPPASALRVESGWPRKPPGTGQKLWGSGQLQCETSWLRISLCHPGTRPPPTNESLLTQEPQRLPWLIASPGSFPVLSSRIHTQMAAWHSCSLLELRRKAELTHLGVWGWGVQRRWGRKTCRHAPEQERAGSPFLRV